MGKLVPTISANFARVLDTDGVGCTLSLGRKVKTGFPAKSFQEENHLSWPNYLPLRGKNFRNRTSWKKAPENIRSLMPLTHEMLWRGARESRSTHLSWPQLSENFQE